MSNESKQTPTLYTFIMSHGFEPDGCVYEVQPKEPHKHVHPPARMVDAKDYAALQSQIATLTQRVERLEAQNAELADATKRTPQTARDDLEKGPGAWLSDREHRLRKMLAFAYSGSNLYGDDGELHDARVPHPIDYMRDSVEQIEAAIYARGMAALSKAHP